MEEPARAAGHKPPFLTVVDSSYREFFGPLLRALQELGEEYPDRIIAIMIPEIVERRWYHFFFRHRTTLLKALLLLRGGPRIALITTPWYIADAASGEEFGARGSQNQDPVKEVVSSTGK